VAVGQLAAFADAPYYAWQNAWVNAPCASWPAKAGKPVDVGNHRMDSLLLIDETLDPATPFEGSLEARSRFPNSALIAEPDGTSHASTLMDGNACVDGKIAAYLADGTQPTRRTGSAVRCGLSAGSPGPSRRRAEPGSFVLRADLERPACRARQAGRRVSPAPLRSWDGRQSRRSRCRAPMFRRGRNWFAAWPNWLPR
jgi:hypothetical protein